MGYAERRHIPAQDALDLDGYLACHSATGTLMRVIRREPIAMAVVVGLIVGGFTNSVAGFAVGTVLVGIASYTPVNCRRDRTEVVADDAD